MGAGLSSVPLGRTETARDVRHTVRLDFVVGIHHRSWIHKNHSGGRIGLVKSGDVTRQKAGIGSFPVLHRSPRVLGWPVVSLSHAYGRDS